MKIDEIKLMSDDQRSDELIKLKKEQFNLRFQRASSQLENTARLRHLRRTIARIRTVSRLSELGKLPMVTKAPVAKSQTKKVAKPVTKHRRRRQRRRKVRLLRSHRQRRRLQRKWLRNRWLRKR